MTRAMQAIETRDARHETRIVRSIFLFAIFGLGVAFANQPIPKLNSRVTDLTHTLTSGQATSLEETLRAFEARKGAQVAVLIVPTVEPESIEQYSMRVAEAWKIGRKGTSDGVLFLIAKDDRNMRIDVGYGLEGVLPDVINKRIIRDVVTPHFKAGEYYLGIVAGVDAITRAIDGEALPEPSFTERARHPGSGIGSIIPVLLIAGIFVGGILRAIFGRFGGASVAAAGAGFIVWLLVGTVTTAAIAAVIAFIITSLTGGGSGWSSGRGGWGGFGGFGGGGFGGGGFGGGGGWSGGGGGFGGGGASGRW